MNPPDFVQDPWRLPCPWESDPALQAWLRAHLPADVLVSSVPGLVRLAHRVRDEVDALGRQAAGEDPVHVALDPWGNRVDDVRVSPAWRRLDAVSAEEGLVAMAYERAFGQHSRVVQAAALHLFTPSSAIYTCPLAMTDGGARLIEVHGDMALREGPYRRFTSRDPGTFWTGGQWMTERAGGSDVGRSGTVARPQPDGSFALWGDKWFTSAVTAQAAFTLARIEGPDGSVTPGSRGLSLFYLETRQADGSWNGIRVNRLKDKLGTRALPTAELTIAGARAVPVGRPGEGVKEIATLFNVTRMYNAIASASLLRRAVVLARDYAGRREAFGRRLRDHPLHARTLARLESDAAAAQALAFRVAALQGREECGIATAPDRALLRILTPLAKAWSGKVVVAGAAEAMECLGGAGYLEDTGFPVLLRDAHVLALWEGTTNVLALDMARAARKEEALPPLLEVVGRGAEAAGAGRLAQALSAVAGAVTEALDRRGEEGLRDVALCLGEAAAASELAVTASMLAGHRDPEAGRTAVLAASRAPVLEERTRRLAGDGVDSLSVLGW